MKKLLLLFAFLMLLLSCSRNESDNSNSTNTPNTNEMQQYEYQGCSGFVEFDSTDKSLLLFLRSKGYDTNNDTKISCEEASKVYEINDLAGVTNFKGIESLSNLKSLKGTYQSNTNDVVINLYNNYLLQEVSLNSGQPSYNLVIVLPKISILKSLIIPFGGYFFNSKILNIENQINLENIEIGGIKGVLNLTNCNKLKTVSLTRNELNDINFSKSINTNLSSLIVGEINNNFQVINTNNKISEIDLSKFPNLVELNLKNISLKNIDLKTNLLLQKIIISKNMLKNVDLSVNNNINYLEISNNELTNLSTESNKNIEYLDVSYNKLPTIDFSQNLKLKNIYLSGNLLSYIDISKNTELVELKCDTNNIKSINLKSNKKLVTFFCSNNQIENIDLSANSNLFYIDVTANNLKYFNLRNGGNQNIKLMKALNVGTSGIIIDKGFFPPEPDFNSNKWYKDSWNNYINN